MAKPITIFLSAVSREFHNPDPADPRRFVSYRAYLAESLRAIRQPPRIVMGDDLLHRMDPDAERGHLGVVSQENLAQGPADLLAALEDEVREATAVIHLVGDMAGAAPGDASLRRLRERHPNFLDHEPELRHALGDYTGITYTQWELWFAFHHCTARFVFIASENTPRSPARASLPEQPALQQEHLTRITKTGEHYAPFADQRDVTRQVVLALVRRGLIDDPTAAPDPEAIEHARSLLEKIVPEIADWMKKPDPAKVFLVDLAGVAPWLAALDTVARTYGLNRISLLTLLDERLGGLLKNAEASPDPALLLELGFTTLALGEYRAAITAANRAIEFAASQLPEDARDIALCEEHLLNAHLLLHDGAIADQDLPLAIRALTEGGKYIDKAKDPIGWADYHEPLAEILIESAQWEAADDLVSDLVDIREEHNGQHSTALAGMLLIWANLLRMTGKFQGALDVTRRAEAIYGAKIPLAISFLGASWQLQGLALVGMNRFDEAEPLLRRALEVYERTFGPERPNTIAIVTHLGDCLQSKGDFTEAEPLLRRALEVRESTLGPEHPDTLNSVSDLEHLLLCKGDLVGAEPLYRRELKWRERTFGSEHPDTLSSMNRLGFSLYCNGNYAEAELFLRRALEARGRALGKEHPDTLDSMNNLASLLRWRDAIGKDPTPHKGDLVEAEALYRSVLEAHERTLGPEHPDTLESVNHLASLLQSKGDLAGAEPLYRRALEAQESTLGPEHPDTLSSADNLARLLEDKRHSPTQNRQFE